MMTWLETSPLWLVGLLILGLLISSVELGYRGRRWLRWRERERPIADGQDHLLSAALGLLALLLGFTFSLALSRHEARRDLVLQEDHYCTEKTSVAASHCCDCHCCGCI